MRTTAALAALVLLLGATPARADWVLNGDFSSPGAAPEPFFGWTTFDAGGANARPTDVGGVAMFSESPNFSGVQLEQRVSLPPGVRLLSFEYRLRATPDATGGSPVPDSFQATLYRPDLLSTVAPADPLLPDQFPGFYSVDSGPGGADYFDSSLVTRTAAAGGWRRVSLDLTGVGASPDLLLEFRLNGSDDAQQTTVELRDVRGLSDPPVTPVPAPAGVPLLVGMVACLLAAQFRRRVVSRVRS